MFEERLLKEGSAPLLLPDGLGLGLTVNVQQGMVSWKETKKMVSQMMCFFFFFLIWMMLLLLKGCY